MDTVILQSAIRAKRNKTILIFCAAVIVVIGGIFFLRAGIKTSVKKSEITTAVVEMGSIENTLTASGQIIAEFEQQVTSPINASIKDVLVDAGTTVKAGQPILSLDKEATQVEYEKLKFQLESKRNSIQKLRLELGKSFYDIKSNNN